MNSGDIGRKVRDLRKKLGMTLAELGERIAISQGQMSRLESGKQGFRSATLLRIADALDVKPIYFFMDDDDESGQGDTPPYGLLAGGDLAGALRSPEFTWVAEKLASSYLHREDAFAAIRLAVAAILGEPLSQTRSGDRTPPSRRRGLPATKVR